MRSETSTKTALAKRRLVIARIFDAPRERVFQMWTDPKHLAAWWGPKDFTNPVCEVDARQGGAIRIVMRAPDGAEHPMTGVFSEFNLPERLVFRHAALDREGNPIIEAVSIVTFTERDRTTELHLETHAEALTPEAAARIAGMEAGWNQSIDRLAQQLAK